MHDKAPFSVWDEEARKFHIPTPEQRRWVEERYDIQGWEWKAHFLFLKTENPPKPVPLTLGCMLVLFIGVGD